MKLIIFCLIVMIGLSDCLNPAAGDFPKKEGTCKFLVACRAFPQKKICGLAKNGCFSPITFNNNCELNVFNCEHPSNQYYKYMDGTCYPGEFEMITISPIEIP